MDSRVVKPRKLVRAQRNLRLAMFVDLFVSVFLLITHITGWHITYTYDMLTYMSAFHVFLWSMALAVSFGTDGLDFVYIFLGCACISTIFDFASVLARLFIISTCTTIDCATNFIYAIAWLTFAFNLTLLLIDAAYIFLSRDVAKYGGLHILEAERLATELFAISEACEHNTDQSRPNKPSPSQLPKKDNVPFRRPYRATYTR
jgi:hypothetical protein